MRSIESERQCRRVKKENDGSPLSLSAADATNRIKNLTTKENELGYGRTTTFVKNILKI